MARPVPRRGVSIFYDRTGMMSQAMGTGCHERYAWESGRYVLYVGSVPVLATRRVAVLLDVRLGALVTHGDPDVVRRELAEMQRVSRAAGLSRYEADWLLLEGSPQVDDLNRVLCSADDLDIHREAFLPPERRVGWRLARALLIRIAKRSAPPLGPSRGGDRP